MAGYSPLVARAINEAPSVMVGVKLGQRCVALGIPVADVAEYLKVSTSTVYAWFKGTTHVPVKRVRAVVRLTKKLT